VTEGGVIYGGKGPIVWYSTKQRAVAKLSAEAEYVGRSTIASEIVWVTNVLSKLGHKILNPVVIHGDNMAARIMAENSTNTSRAKQ
jgi:hypothetical protein